MSDGKIETIYQEVCENYRNLDDFRGKLLGLLPLTSGVVFFGTLIEQSPPPALSVLGIFGAFVTLGLGVHEYRTIRRCEALKNIGQALERDLIEAGPTNGKADETTQNGEQILGVFQAHPDKPGRPDYYPLISTGTASLIVYGTTFSAWLFIAGWVVSQSS